MGLELLLWSCIDYCFAPVITACFNIKSQNILKLTCSLSGPVGQFTSNLFINFGLTLCKTASILNAICSCSIVSRCFDDWNCSIVDLVSMEICQNNWQQIQSCSVGVCMYVYICNFLYQYIHNFRCPFSFSFIPFSRLKRTLSGKISLLAVGTSKNKKFQSDI